MYCPLEAAQHGFTGELVTKAIDFATRAHTWQEDRKHYAYITHVIRVAYRLVHEVNESEVGTPDWVIAAAILHDVVEDTPTTLHTLREAGFPEETIALVDVLTHKPEETYEQYVARAAQGYWSKRIKLADISDNTAKWRTPGAIPKKYIDATEVLFASLYGERDCATCPPNAE